MAEGKIAAPYRCRRCFSRTAEMGQVVEDGVAYYQCLDEAGCAARIEETANAHQAQEPAPKRIMVTRPEPTAMDAAHKRVDDLIASYGDEVRDMSISDIAECYVGQRVSLVVVLAVGMAAGQPALLSLGPQGILVAVMEDGYLIRDAGGVSTIVAKSEVKMLQAAR